MEGFNIAGVQFHRAGKIYDFRYDQLELRVGDHVMVEGERGPSLAQVARIEFQALPLPSSHRPFKSILRKIPTKDVFRDGRVSTAEIEAFTNRHIRRLGLKMKLLKTEIQFGGTKILIYFSAPGRVDFRELVKELAAGLRARVELKQVGARDEAKLLGGVGICGREYCCSSFLREFVPVSIRMAKNQNLALNPNKVSGGCGRLLCCLTYENEVYTHLRQTMPPRGTKVLLLETQDTGKVVKTDLLNQTALVETERGETLVKIQQLQILDQNMIPESFEGGSEEDQELDSQWGEDLDLEALTAHMQSSSSQGRPPARTGKQGDRPLHKDPSKKGAPSDQKKNQNKGYGRQENSKVKGPKNGAAPPTQEGNPHQGSRKPRPNPKLKQ